MEIKSVKYKNYRCFIDMFVSFETTPEKNISLIVAPNGGGKTEMLFSFQWALYNFDFTKLKSKDHTPYALNSALYQKMQNSSHSAPETCSVELKFVADGLEYTILREETYTKNSSSITQNQSVHLWNTKPNGETTPPIVGQEAVERVLQRVIPKNILSGIIFDGERMKELNNSDDDAKEAVQGVIKQITNEELFELCRTEFQQMKKALHRSIKSTSKDSNLENIEALNSLISQLEGSLELNKTSLQAKKESRAKLKITLDNIGHELEQLKETKEYERQRNSLRQELDKKSKILEALTNDVMNDLSDGYLLVADKLIEDVEESLEQFDVPEGLTVEAVRSIMKRTTCICGAEMTQDMLHHLEEMIKTLPPDNINSTIHEIARHMRMNQEDQREKLKRVFRNLRETENDIAEIKQNLAQISSLITEGASESAKELEQQNTTLSKDLVKLDSDIQNLEDKISSETTKLDNLKRQMNNASKANSSVQNLNAQLALLDRYIEALDEIDKRNKLVSLSHINRYLKDAYKLVSEDTIRSLRIVQYEEKYRYRMLPYSEEKFNELYEEFKANGTMDTWKALEYNEEQIEENIIILLQENSSTGQNKVNALAFAKAILDYSREARDEESTEISKDYPFLIDSPFTELSGENITKSAENIHLFSHQLILMISEESLVSTRAFLQPFINSETTICKNVAKGYSFVKKED